MSSDNFFNSDVGICVWFSTGAFLIGMIGGGYTTSNPDAVLNIACVSACDRLGTEMLSVQENVCLCKNLKVMSGDYGQLFLKGE
jgi:hypothetical protein